MQDARIDARNEKKLGAPSSKDVINLMIFSCCENEVFLT